MYRMMFIIGFLLGASITALIIELITLVKGGNGERRDIKK